MIYAKEIMKLINKMCHSNVENYFALRDGVQAGIEGLERDLAAARTGAASYMHDLAAAQAALAESQMAESTTAGILRETEQALSAAQAALAQSCDDQRGGETGMYPCQRAVKAEADLAAAQAERDAWIDTANQHCRNEQFYHGLLTAVGELFGDAAKQQDDGGLCENVLALRVHECVYAALADLAVAQSRHLERDALDEQQALVTARLVAQKKMTDDFITRLADLAAKITDSLEISPGGKNIWCKASASDINNLRSAIKDARKEG